MSRSLKLSERKKLERIYLQGRERGKAAAYRRMHQAREQDDSEADHEQPRHDDEE